MTVHLWYLIGFENRLFVLTRWVLSFIAHGRGARLITDTAQRPTSATPLRSCSFQHSVPQVTHDASAPPEPQIATRWLLRTTRLHEPWTRRPSGAHYRRKSADWRTMQSKLLPLTQRDPENWLHNALSDHVVFHSPVRDYHGRADVAHILMTIGGVLDEIESQRELVAERQVVTIITAVHGHHRMSGVLDESHDALGRVERATLLLRPLSTLLEAITAMRAALVRSPLPSTLAASS